MTDPPGPLAAFVPRSVSLPEGRTLVLRASDPSDVDRFVAFYGSLSPEDRRLRFFSAVRPGREFLTRWTSLCGEGGYGLVALVDGEMVAEAGYSLLPDGTGELAVTVHPDWRGWLGPYLLDALVDTAAARGVPQLQAEVLLENRAMLMLIRTRGFVAIAHPDSTTVRLAIGTTDRVPSWPQGHTRPRILVEVRGARWRAEADARSAGLEVAACPGPTNARHPGCPVLEGRPCPLAMDADAIVLAFGPDDPGAAALAVGHGSLHPDVMLFIEPQPDGASVAAPDGAFRLPACTPSEEVGALIRALVGQPDVSDAPPPAAGGS